MSKRQFREFQVTLTATVRLSPRAIRQGMSKQFAETIFPATSPERVAEYIGFNLICNNIGLSSIDGFANLPDTDADADRAEVDDCYEVETTRERRRRQRKAPPVSARRENG